MPEENRACYLKDSTCGGQNLSYRTGHEDLEPIVTELASKWVHNNYKGFSDSDGFMFEKYNALHPGVPPGHGDGEYQLQNGFGWTNGVLLHILNRYFSELSYLNRDYFVSYLQSLL